MTEDDASNKTLPIFFLNAYDDLFKRPSKSQVFSAGDLFKKPEPSFEFEKDAELFSQVLKRELLLYDNLVFPAQWIFNNPLFFAITSIPRIRDNYNTENLIKSETLCPVFDDRTNFQNYIS